MLLLILAATNGLTLASVTERRQYRFKVGDSQYGQCQVEGRYPKSLDSFNSLETVRTYKLPSSWSERCRNCTCGTYGAWCTGPLCDSSYDFTQENWCLQWSRDGCCCEQLGCTIDGQEYPLGAEYPYGNGNPCLMCTCGIGTSRDYCLRQKCGTYYVICEDEDVVYDDHCCPEYTCPPVACTEVPDPFPDTPRHELRDWYGGQLDPIPVGVTQHYHLDTWTTYVCRCPSGGTAECAMESHVRH